MGTSTLARDQGDRVFSKDKCFRLNWGSQGFKPTLLYVRWAAVSSAWLSREALRKALGLAGPCRQGRWGNAWFQNPPVDEMGDQALSGFAASGSPRLFLPRENIATIYFFGRSSGTAAGRGPCPPRAGDRHKPSTPLLWGLHLPLGPMFKHPWSLREGGIFIISHLMFQIFPRRCTQKRSFLCLPAAPPLTALGEHHLRNKISWASPTKMLLVFEFWNRWSVLPPPGRCSSMPRGCGSEQDETISAGIGLAVCFLLQPSKI